MPSLAPQHTFSARKEPENKDLGAQTVIWLRLDPGSDSGVHHGIHPETDCASGLPHASPEYIQFIPSGDGFCLCVKCPPNTFLSDAIPYAAPASLITSCFDRLRLNRRLLRRNEMTDSP